MFTSLLTVYAVILIFITNYAGAYRLYYVNLTFSTLEYHNEIEYECTNSQSYEEETPLPRRAQRVRRA